jgi:hypothetical protein
MTSLPLPYDPKDVDPRNRQIAFLADKYQKGELKLPDLQEALSRFDLPVRPPDQPMPGYGPDPAVMGTPQQVDPQSPPSQAPIDTSSRDRELAVLANARMTGEISVDEYMDRLNNMIRSGREFGVPISKDRINRMATLSSDDRQTAKDMLAEIQKRSAGDGG